MIMLVVVPVVTALVMIVVGAFRMFMMFIGMNGISEQEGIPILPRSSPCF